MAIQQFIGKETYNQMLKDEEGNIQEFVALEKGLKIEKASRLYAENLISEKVVHKVIGKLGEQKNEIIKLEGENEMLNEENKILKQDLQDLNKYDSKKYDEMRRKHSRVVLRGNKNNIEQDLMF
jgi:hypothetical protein